MDERILYQLDKVLALADSDHEGEALGALRMMRRILTRDNLSFADLVGAVRPTLRARAAKPFNADQVQWEAKLDQLHDEIDAHIMQNQSLSEQIEFWRRRSFELEQMLSLNQAETARWKEMARETAERLWDLGQMAKADAFFSPETPSLALEEEEDNVQPLKATG